MAFLNGSYVSVFKINGKPILSPVIDENRRIELQRDRMLAIEIERRLQLKRAQRNIPTETCKSNVTTINNDEALNKEGVDCSASNCDTSAAIDSLLDDHENTLRHDIVSETAQDIQHIVHSLSNELHDSTKSSNTVPLSLAIFSDSNFNSITPKNLSPSFSLHSSPSVGALDESRNLSLYFTPTSGRESFSPIPFQTDQFSAARLIRSNSYTLDKPSPMLLKHMENSGAIDSSLKSPMAKNRFQNQNNTPSCIPRKSMLHSTAENAKEIKSCSSTVKTPGSSATMNILSNAKVESMINSSTKSKSIKSTKGSNKSVSKRQSSNEMCVFKNSESILRSIYGLKQVAKVQHSGKKNKSLTASMNSVNKSMVKPTQTHINDSILSTTNGNNNERYAQNYGEILAMFEKQHAELLKRQQDEQKRMQEEFLRQQEELLQKMANLISNKSSVQITPNGSIEESTAVLTNKSNENMLIDEVNNELPVIVESNGYRINRFTPESGKCIRRLRYDDNKFNLNNNNSSNNNNNNNNDDDDDDNQLHCYKIEEVRAANIIVAHAKGYITRRLLRTKKVRDLKKMHCDTFDLLLDISEEDIKNESKSDVEFKFNLLQQLASVGAEIYEIFFKMPMIERMNIIAKDRERQQQKLNITKSLDKNKTMPKVINGNSHSKLSKR